MDGHPAGGAGAYLDALPHADPHRAAGVDPHRRTDGHGHVGSFLHALPYADRDPDALPYADRPPEQHPHRAAGGHGHAGLRGLDGVPVAGIRLRVARTGPWPRLRGPQTRPGRNRGRTR